MNIASYSAHRHYNNPEVTDHAAAVAKNPNQAFKKANNPWRLLSSMFQASMARLQKQNKKPKKDRPRKLVIQIKIKMKKIMNIKTILMTNPILQSCNVILNTLRREIMMLLLRNLYHHMRMFELFLYFLIDLFLYVFFLFLPIN